MIYTARQLEDLHKASGANGHVVLPYRAKLSPLAQDWVRLRKVKLGYADTAPTIRGVAAGSPGNPATGLPVPSGVEGPLRASEPTDIAAPLPYFWWCDGPCGPAKAALQTVA